jgi:ProP effector
VIASLGAASIQRLHQFLRALVPGLHSCALKDRFGVFGFALRGARRSVRGRCVLTYAAATVGFEQLTELKEQLSKPAKTKARARADRTRAASSISKAKPAANAKPVDPVVLHIGRLQKRFPEAFPKNPAPKIPLKIGIFEDLIRDIAELKLSQAELRDAITIWCRGSPYWTALIANAIRMAFPARRPVACRPQMRLVRKSSRKRG